MKTYKVSVNGNVYEVSVEETLESCHDIPITESIKTDTQVPGEKQIEKPVAAQINNNSSNLNNVICPMPGVILNILVSVGDTVTENQPIIILEAMKMENEIVAPMSGVISSINVVKGANANVSEVLAIIK